MLENERLLQRHPAMLALKKAALREIWLEKAVAFAVLLSGAVLLWSYFPKEPLGAGLGLLLLVIGLRLCVPACRMWRAEQHPLLQLLERQPRRIVRVYSEAMDLMPFGFYVFSRGTLFFDLEDGQCLSIGVPTRQLKLISRTLNRVLPHAEFGRSSQ